MSFDKSGYQRTLFLWQSSTAGDDKRGNACAKRIMFLKILYEFERYGSHGMMKGFKTKGWNNDHSELFLKHLKEQLQQRLNVVWSGVQD